jgi:hypothetical protein
LGTICQAPVAAMISGAINLVSDDPALPAPKMPIAVPCRSLLNQVEV